MRAKVLEKEISGLKEDIDRLGKNIIFYHEAKEKPLVTKLSKAIFEKTATKQERHRDNLIHRLKC